MSDDEQLLREMWCAYTLRATPKPFCVKEAMRAVLAVARAHDRDGERWRQLIKLATQWPQTVLVVNINIGHDWHTADAPKQIRDVVDAAMRAEG